MKEYVYSVLCAAVCSGIICTLAPKKSGLDKYVSFAVALAVALTLLHPFYGEYDFSELFSPDKSVSHDSAGYTVSAAVDILCTAYGIEKSEINASAEITDTGEAEKIIIYAQKYKLAGKETAENELSELFRTQIVIIDKDSG